MSSMLTVAATFAVCSVPELKRAVSLRRATLAAITASSLLIPITATAQVPQANEYMQWYEPTLMLDDLGPPTWPHDFCPGWFPGPSLRKTCPDLSNGGG
jgi:hypothetical protein